MSSARALWIVLGMAALVLTGLFVLNVVLNHAWWSLVFVALFAFAGAYFFLKARSGKKM
jgi:hypothetical protein